MKVAFITLDWSDLRDPNTGWRTTGGAGWYRMALPAEYLALNGVDASLGTRVMFDVKRGIFGSLDRAGERIEDLDVVVLQRWMDLPAPDFILQARSNGQVVLNDVDDYFDGLHTTNAAWAATHPKTDPHSNRNHYRKALAASSGIIVSTPFLQEKMQHVNDRVLLVRNAIDLARWPQRDVGASPVIGWVGATSYRSEDLQVCVHPVSDFLSRHPESSFFHGGHDRSSNNVPALMGMNDGRGGWAAMQSILDYPTLFGNFNLGIVPLNDIAFNHAKSAIKGLEYAASGIPFVASATPEYQWLSTEHDIGLVATKAKHWKAMLEHLADPTERVRLGAAYRQRVAAFDISEQWKTWMTAIEEFTR